MTYLFVLTLPTNKNAELEFPDVGSIMLANEFQNVTLTVFSKSIMEVKVVVGNFISFILSQLWNHITCM
jgi:hypothetical protein